MFAAAGIDAVKIPPRAPKTNAYAERWVRTVHTECPTGSSSGIAHHLEHVLTDHVAHDNTARPHRAIDLDVPIPPAQPIPARIDNVRRIERVDVLGGLIHEYRHAA